MGGFSPDSYMFILREVVGMDAHSVVDDWDDAPFDGGFGGIDKLASRGFSGAIEANGTWLFLRDGEALAAVTDLDVDPRPGDIDAFKSAAGRQHEAPTAGVATVAAMAALGGNVRGTYFTDDTPLEAVDETLAGGGFTGYVELSENVLSGDYYYVYLDGAVDHVAFVGSEQLLTGEEAESRAEGEVGIYDVVAVELPRPDLPEPDSPTKPDSTPATAATGVDSDAGASSDVETGSDPDLDTDADPDSTADAGTKTSTGGDTQAGTTGLGAETEAEAGAETDVEAEAEADTGIDTEAEGDFETAWLNSDAEPDSDTAPGTGTEPDTDSEPDSDVAPDADTALDADTAPDSDLRRATDETASDDRTGGVGDRLDTDVEVSDDPDEDDDKSGGDGEPPGDRNGASTVAAVTDDGDDGETLASGAAAEDSATRADTAGAGEAALDREAHDDRIEQYESRIAELEADLAAADSQIAELEAELESLRAERDDLQRRVGSVETPESESLTPEAALAETRLFVRQRSRGEGTLSDAHDGAEREAVVSNLRIEYHTTFDDESVSVEGEPFEGWLRSSDAHAFVEWLATELLFEIRSAGQPEAVRPLYDALPEIDRIGFDETIAVGDGIEGREVEFDIVARDKSGHPLVVATFDRGRDPTYADAIEPFVADATDVCAAHDTLAGAVAITSSYFESDAMSVVGEATSSSLLSRSRYQSYVKLSRANGYHLCLVESREGSFNLTIPEL